MNTLNKYKWELQEKVKMLQPGERHKDFQYPVFVDLPKKFIVHANTPLIQNEIKTPVCYAGDLKRNFIEIYTLKKIDWEGDEAEVESVDSKLRYTYYLDAIALVPVELLKPAVKMKLLDDKKAIEIGKEQRQRRKKLLK